MSELHTPRLSLRRIEVGDAGFVLELLNQPSFVRFIGDRGVRTRADAETYIATAWQASYATNGFGMYLTALTNAVPIGICGLVKRETLPDVDLGFAYLPEYWGMGYAFESASAVLEHARRDFGLRRILAIVNADNRRSISLLERLEFAFERPYRHANERIAVCLYSRSL
ncbi:MAG: hypothetical protein MNPFHGCM_02025 [Gemmatimonadaceae bacterium]|nr:hypothetical protein [Gemmatimonadaceae bacterium]